jgi:hypothetical protein
MNETRPAALLWIALVVLVLSIALLGTWAYYSHQRDVVASRSFAAGGAPMASGKSTSTGLTVQDTLQNLYSVALQELDHQAAVTQKNLDSLRIHLTDRLSESNQLRTEIGSLLKNGAINTDEAILVRQKIMVLQQKIEELRRINRNVEEENRKLKNVLAQLSAGQSLSGDVNTRSPTTESNLPLPATSGGVVVSELRLQAVVQDNEREQETTDAQQAEKIVGSFVARANGASGDLMVVVVQPDGRVMQNSTWDAGSFDTREGKKIYSVRLRLDPNSREAKPYLFSIGAERFQRGSYTLQIYQNGALVARTTRTLS